MNRWAARIAGLIMLLVFALMFTAMYKQLVAIQRAQQPAPTSTSR